MLNEITPLILTYNEAPNIARTIEKLSWAGEIVVVDSFSTDDTLSILAKYDRVRVVQRAFDNHFSQWNFALHETGIKTEWVLALDADYIVTDELIDELKRMHPDNTVSGYSAPFKFRIHGRTLRGTLYPPVTVLYRRNNATYVQDGHTQRVMVTGGVQKLSGFIYHDDRKPFSRWVQSQINYMRLEAEKLSSAEHHSLGYADRLRRFVGIAPLAVFFYCLFVKRTILDGKAGIYYALQRMFAEFLLGLFLLEMAFTGKRT